MTRHKEGPFRVTIDCLDVSFCLIGLMIAQASYGDSALASDRALAVDQSVEDVVLARAQDVQVILIEDTLVPARVAGQIQEIDILPGQEVKAGQLLARLDGAEVEQALRKAELEVELSDLLREDDAAVLLARQRVEMTTQRQSRLDQLRTRSPGSISRDRIEEARFAAKEAIAELKAALSEKEQSELTSQIRRQTLQLHKLRLSLHSVVSPIDGFVAEVNVSPGQWMGEGQGVIRVVGLDRLRVEAFVPSHLVTLACEGKPARFVAELTGKERSDSLTAKGVVSFVSPIIQSVTGETRIWVDLDNTDGKLRPGTRGVVEVLDFAKSKRE